MIQARHVRFSDGFVLGPTYFVSGLVNVVLEERPEERRRRL